MCQGINRSNANGTRFAAELVDRLCETLPKPRLALHLEILLCRSFGGFGGQGG
jgi:hypothetical protein